MSGSLAIDLTGTSAGFQAAMREAASVSEKEMAKAKKAIEYATKAIQDIEKSQRAAAAAAGEQAKIGEAINRIAPQARGASISVAQMNNALRQTPAQLTDIVTQLAGGQSPFMIMIQQGGQLRDMFGGFGNMFRGLATMISPAGVAIGAVAAAVGGLGYAYAQGVKEQEEFNKAIRLTNGYAGLTSATFQALSEGVAASAKVSIGSAKEIVQALSGSGAFGPELIKPTAEAVAALQRQTGDSTDAIVKDFARMRDGVTKWAEEHNKQHHFLTATQLQYIRDLDEQGKSEEAAKVTMAALTEQVKDSAGWWSRLGHAVASYWDSVKSLSQDESTADKLRRVQNMIETKQSSLPGLSGRAASVVRDEIARLAQERAQLQQINLREQAAAGDRSRRQAYEESLDAANRYIEKLRDETKGTALVTKELEKYRAKVAELRGTKFEVSPAKQRDDEAWIRNKYNPESERLVKQSQQEREDAVRRVKAIEAEAQARGVSAREAYIEQKVLEALGKVKDKDLERRVRAAAAAMYDKARSEAFTKSLTDQSVAIDKEVRSLRLESSMLGMTSIDRQKAADAIRVQAEAEKLKAQYTDKAADIDAWATEQVKKLTQAHQDAYDSARQFSTGATKAFAAYRESVGDAGRYAENLVSGSFHRMEDVLVKFARTGKLQFSDLFGFMADEYLRQQARMMMSQGATSLLGMLGPSFLASHTGAATTVANSMGGDALDNLVSVTDAFRTRPGHANGLDYVPYDNYIARLHEGERVMTKQEARAHGGGQPVVVNQTNHIGAGVTRTEMMAGLAQFREATKADILSSMNHNGIFGRRAT